MTTPQHSQWSGSEYVLTSHYYEKKTWITWMFKCGTITMSTNKFGLICWPPLKYSLFPIWSLLSGLRDHAFWRPQSSAIAWGEDHNWVNFQLLSSWTKKLLMNEYLPSQMPPYSPQSSFLHQSQLYFWTAAFPLSYLCGHLGLVIANTLP